MAKARKAKSAKRFPSVGILGYGSQGRAIARNLSDTGYPVMVGLRKGSPSRKIAKRDGMKSIMTIPDVVRKARVVCFAFPDHAHWRVFDRSVKPHLRRGQTLWFLHAASIHFRLVEPPKTVDIILIAPHAPGDAVRDEFLTDRSLSAFYAVHQNRTGDATRTASALARDIGVSRRNLLKTTFEREAVGDLFGEQAVLCGGLAMLIKTGFETLVERGWKPDHAYLEVAYQLDLIVALIKRHGVKGMLTRISPAAQLGSVESGPRVVGPEAKQGMAEAFDRIRSGEFAQRLADLNDTDLAKLRRSLARLTDPELERAARKFSK